MNYEDEIDGVINDLKEVFDARMAFIEDDDDFEDIFANKHAHRPIKRQNTQDQSDEEEYDF